MITSFSASHERCPAFVDIFQDLTSGLDVLVVVSWSGNLVSDDEAASCMMVQQLRHQIHESDQKAVRHTKTSVFLGGLAVP